ncbi:hypothetical protein LY90DRAFT_520127 [Neocallimastix californiae]|uniref:Uncharacterized protein n=1 Tax=Neocallimastix californiae TaxID=1754190 RepID=A0A1Y1YH73_9FUNG|nr:hypothetical protein LY90DRAFT_520127 [Neocallimastix californiae]|eukprot:ORX97223.1 hypothetical protein LY90DRAFT_520127 [Neocallimastix californiae]
MVERFLKGYENINNQERQFVYLKHGVKEEIKKLLHHFTSGLGWNYKKVNVDDYIEAIKSRIYSCMFSLRERMSECQSLEDAINHSERAGKIEKILIITENIRITQEMEITI